jgi:RimJ/RimL family protein N-acetyltransferase
MIKTKRLYLRRVEIEDAKSLLPIWKDKEVTQYTMIRNIATVDDCINRIRRQLTWLKRNSIGTFVILENDEIIGYCGGNNSEERQSEYEIFYHFAKTKWGNGYGTEIAKALIEYGFKEKKATVIRAEACIVNIDSWKVLEKSGMKRIETTKNTFKKETGKYDMYRYEIKREDFQ